MHTIAHAFNTMRQVSTRALAMLPAWAKAVRASTIILTCARWGASNVHDMNAAIGCAQQEAALRPECECGNAVADGLAVGAAACHLMPRHIHLQRPTPPRDGSNLPR